MVDALVLDVDDILNYRSPSFVEELVHVAVARVLGKVDWLVHAKRCRELLRRWLSGCNCAAKSALVERTLLKEVLIVMRSWF